MFGFRARPFFRPPPTRMAVGLVDAWTAGVSHSPDTGPMPSHAHGPAFPNVLAALAKSFPASRAWWQEAKTRLFEVAEALGEGEVILMALALPELEARLRRAPGPRGETLDAMARRIGSPREDLALLVADKVAGKVRMGSGGTVLPPVGGLPRGTPPRPGKMFDAMSGKCLDGHPMAVGGYFPARQIAHALRRGDPAARRFVAGAHFYASRGSRAHLAAVGLVARAASLETRNAFVAHYGGLGRAIEGARRASAGLATEGSNASANWHRDTRIAWHEGGDLT